MDRVMCSFPGKHFVAVVVTLALALSSAGGVLAQDAEMNGLSACQSAPEVNGSEQLLDPESALTVDMPPGLALAVLADTATDQWPPFARGLVMTVRHLTLDPGVTAASRQTQGPLLFYIETGSVALSINGQPQTFDRGETVLIERGQNYQIRNDDAANPATVLRLQIVPPGKETQVARGDLADVRDDEQEFIPGPPFILSRLLLTAEMPALEGLTHLILGCLTWSDEAPDNGETSHPGPVGLLVLEGQLLVGDSGSLAAGQCVVFQPRTPHRLRAGSPSPVILVVGAVPDGVPFWGSPAEDGGAQSGGRLEFNCDQQAEPDAIPDAANTVPAGLQSWARL